MDRPISTCLGSLVQKDGAGAERTALIEWGPNPRSISYDELDVLTDRMGQHMLNRGIGRGDIVVVMLTNCCDLQICYFACFKIGAIMQPLNFQIGEAEVSYVIGQCRPRMLITNSKLLARIGKATELADMELVVVGDAPPPATTPFSALLEPLPVSLPAAVQPDDFAQLFFVFTQQASQFNGRGVLLSHRVLSWHSLPYERMGLTGKDVVAGVLHPYNALTRAVMKAGATYVLIPEFTGEEFLRCCESYPISFLGATPGMFEQCLLASRKSGIVPKSLRACFAVGGTLDPALWREFEERFETRIFGGMGCKELGIFSLEPADRPSRHGSIGQVLPYMEARIASAESPLGDSRQRGFLWVKSESIITHYWIDGKPSPLRSEQGWFPTGYEVHRDNEDYLYCTGATLDQSISGQKRYFNIG